MLLAVSCSRKLEAYSTSRKLEANATLYPPNHLEP
ncbi:hypothetical protein TBK1r_53040 [Stieleria magnilauensis]|uniref:Uncharacterized protein n=1 Tax=Stieleria magnilauensis TaxID=2527963 RepID=A0ABX5XXV8_9BACT|nr:hypothetical protein TBK1r_53040 [Planctomycetes bacterium TBK1r]